MDLSKQMQVMKTPRSRSEFERNAHIFLEQLNRGKMSFPEDPMIIYSLTKLALTLNRRLDFLSVTEFARLQMNMAESMQNIFDEDR